MDCDPRECGGQRCAPKLRNPILRMHGWGECPERARLSPYWQGVLRLYNLSKVSPLAGWGEAYSNGAEVGVVLLSSAIDRVQAERLAEASGGKHGPR